MITSEQLNQIKLEAIEAYPYEAIWFLTKMGGLYQVENIHPEPEEHFSVSGMDSLQAQKEGLLAVIHSHCDKPEVPSKLDMELQERLAIPCGIISTNGKMATNINWLGDQSQPLIGRTFAHGTADCYSIVRDYYFQKKGVVLQDVPREWQWWNSGEENYLADLFASRGFYEIPMSQAKEGDVALIRVRGPVIHHCGVVVGNDLLLHHPGADEPVDKSKLSIEEPIYRYLPYVEKFVRFKELC